MQTKRILLIGMGLMSFCLASFAQQPKDTLVIKTDSIILQKKISDTAKLTPTDTISKKIYYPRTAAIRSAILPGLGQAYNKKYWKIPIVYGALITTAVVFKFNLTQYKRIRFAYTVLINNDTANFKKVDTDLQPFIQQNATAALRNYRNEYRKNIDYSVLVFLVFWGLNVVDATVDAHLKGFDVGTDLTLKIKPGYNPGTNTTGISFVFDIHKPKVKPAFLPAR